MTSILRGSASTLTRQQADPDAAGAAGKQRIVVASEDHAKPELVRPRSTSRHPRTQVMLGRLRTELGRIFRTPCTPADARDEIAEALGRAQLGGWSLPALDDARVARHADESRSIRLVSHVIVINPWGAFRIVDCMRPATPYFEMAGCTGRAFALPPAVAAKDALSRPDDAPGCGAK